MKILTANPGPPESGYIWVAVHDGSVFRRTLWEGAAYWHALAEIEGRAQWMPAIRERAEGLEEEWEHAELHLGALGPWDGYEDLDGVPVNKHLSDG